jgi:hypothetical protein
VFIHLGNVPPLTAWPIGSPVTPLKGKQARRKQRASVCQRLVYFLIKLKYIVRASLSMRKDTL